MAMDAAEPDAVSPQPLGSKDRARILGYISVLIFMLGFGGPYLGLFDVPVSFFLKNKLHFQAHQVADFKLFSAVPLYLSFLFGFARDIWNPFGMRDRGFLVLFGAIAALAYAGFAFAPVNRDLLIVGLVIITCAFLFTLAAQNGLTAAMGQQHVMSGQVSAVWNLVSSVPLVLALLIGGELSGQLEKLADGQAIRVLFLIGAAVMAAVAVFGAWRPASVFDKLHAEHKAKTTPWADMKRVVRHWPVYPALLIWLLWNFAPGSQTPLQYYLQDTLHARDAQWGQWQAIFAIGFVPTFALYGFLCQRFPLRTLLFWGTVVAVPQMVPLLLIHSIQGALIAAFFIGLMGGVSSAAYIDLLIRCSPPGLQGTTLMMSNALFYIVSRFGDVLGTNLYDHFGGFKICVIATTVVYALILPALWLAPRRLTATADGVAPVGGFGSDA